MQVASGTQSVAADRSSRARTALACGRALAAALAAVLCCAACGLKGSLTLPEKPGNVVIRPGPGGEAAPAPAPETERRPPPELPPDTRGNTRD